MAATATAAETKLNLKELSRIALELEAFPYRPGCVEPARASDGPHVRHAAGGRYRVEPEQLGAPVYHEIISEGGRGTRKEVRRDIDGFLAADIVTVTSAAALRVAVYRRVEPWRVTTPLMPIESARFYSATVFQPDDALLTEAAEAGAWVARGLKRHSTRPYADKGCDAMYVRACRAWRAALNAFDSGIEEHLEEQAKIEALMAALRCSVTTLNRLRASHLITRLITLEED